LAKPAGDARDAVVDDALARGVAEAHGHGRRLDALDGVVEGVREGGPRELAVGHDVEAEVDLARDGGAHLLVDGIRRRRAVEQARRAQQAPDDLGARWAANGGHGADLLRNPDRWATLVVRRAVRSRAVLVDAWLPRAAARHPARPAINALTYA